MAVFSQRLWKDGKVQFPGRRKLTNLSDSSTKTVQVSREEGNVYTKGDEFNAASLNNLESRLAKAFNEAERQVLTAADLINLYYPVGKILYSLVDFKLEQSGHAMFPGTTWVRLQEGRAIAPSTAISKTGNETASFKLDGTVGIRGDSLLVGYHTTTLEEIPKHAHSFVDKDYNLTFQWEDGYADGSKKSNYYTDRTTTYSEGTFPTSQTTEHTHKVDLTTSFTPSPATINLNLRQRGLKVYAWQRTR